MSSDITIWLIFGGLIALLIGFLVFSFIKDKRKNRKLAQKRYELKRVTIKTSKELAIKIYTLIEYNNDLVKNIRPGQSKMKMKDINFDSRKFLKRIYDSKIFKTIYIESEDVDPKYSQYLKNLIDKKSNLWNKYCQEEINYFKSLHDELLDDENFNIIKTEAINEIKQSMSFSNEDDQSGE